MSLKSLTFVTICFLLFQQANAQRNYEEYNRIGLTGGLILFDINTDNLVTEQGNGFEGGLTTRGSFRGPFDLIFGVSFYDSNIGIQGRPILTGDPVFINYNLMAAQVGILGSLNIIKHHLSLEFGPILNVNSKLEVDNDRFNDYILEGYSTLTAKDIQDINRINFRAAAGITAGLEVFRLSAMYQYGVSNMLGKLSDQGLESKDFEGHSSTIVFAATFYF
ncbi:hypothetical protein [Ulvibacter antarcticus]|uniref:Outer membrane protein with beta-barrel domain n=1 Tax=Ulvibacter antarcticus TaxID=442714 RepID=A0A3L9YZK7_9FLAO|nr:hypothetical protein [Ulvibacter antarcticus]RMA66013.1 hypothetical protein BXY75_0429 [Ulvibacter antarcticus]